MQRKIDKKSTLKKSIKKIKKCSTAKKLVSPKSKANKTVLKKSTPKKAVVAKKSVPKKAASKEQLPKKTIAVAKPTLKVREKMAEPSDMVGTTFSMCAAMIREVSDSRDRHEFLEGIVKQVNEFVKKQKYSQVNI